MNYLIFPLLLGLGLAGCSQSSQESKMQAPAQAELASDAVADAEQAPSSNEVRAAPKPTAELPTTPRLLVYHADVRLKVASLPQASARLDSLVQRNGGYVSASAETRADGEWRQETVVRVRPAQFGGLLAAIAGLGTVEDKKLTTDDVTAEHADVAARLRTKRAVEQRYLALLGQAKKVSDMLEIEQKAGEVREEIESTESRLKTLNDEVAYSTISLTCYQPLPIATPDAPMVSLSSRLVGALYDGWALLASLFVGAVSIWPLLLLGPALWWAVRRWRQRKLA